MSRMRILLVDDEHDILSALQDAFEGLGHEVRVASSPRAALECLGAWTPEILLTDLYMQEMTGIELLQKVRRYFPSITPVLMTAQGSIDTAVSAIRLGAFDYLLKPFTLGRIEHLVEKISRFRQLEWENSRLKEQIEFLTLPSSIASKNARMRRLISTAQKVAATDSTVLITGESGTGKTHLAKLLHEGSARRQGPFGVVNCATLSENLLESELFGHVRGSFTGAIRDKVGRLRAAEGGTVFLDEIGDISPSVQTKLLRFLQDREFERVGDTKTIRADVRVIAATNKDLEKEVREGRFREDLYFRLNVIELNMAPLRERGEDLMDFAELFLQQAFERLGREPRPFSEEARSAIVSYGWPGNIRELKNALERAAILCDEQVLREDLPERVCLALERFGLRKSGLLARGAIA